MDHPLRAYAIAKIAADRHLQTTGLDWTILGPGQLTLEEPTGAITVARVLKGTPSSKAPTSRGNVARVIVAVLAEPASICRRRRAVRRTRSCECAEETPWGRGVVGRSGE